MTLVPYIHYTHRKEPEPGKQFAILPTSITAAAFGGCWGDGMCSAFWVIASLIFLQLFLIMNYEAHFSQLTYSTTTTTTIFYPATKVRQMHITLETAAQRLPSVVPTTAHRYIEVSYTYRKLWQSLSVT